MSVCLSPGVPCVPSGTFFWALRIAVNVVNNKKNELLNEPQSTQSQIS